MQLGYRWRRRRDDEPDRFDDLRGTEPVAIGRYRDDSVRESDVERYVDLTTSHLDFEALTRAARLVADDDVID